MTAIATDASRLKALAEPLRLRIGLLLIEDACTVKELAAALGVPPTRLYYHVKILEEHGLIEVAERRMVSGIEERRYRAVEENWVFTSDITTSAVEASGVIGSLFDAMRTEVEVVMHDHPDEPMGEPDSAVFMVTLTELRLTPEEVVEVQERLRGVIDDFGPDRDISPDAQACRMLLVGYKAPGVRGAP
jgi:DNA-binding transcriptional ArsR family regulator